MSDMRDFYEILNAHERIYGSREQVLVEWTKVMNGIFKDDPNTIKRFTPELRDSIEVWIASASATVRASSWLMGKDTFLGSLAPLGPKYVDGLHLPWWTEEYSRPLGEIPRGILADNPCDGNLRSIDEVKFLYQHTTLVHSKMFNIRKLHPGKWHPDFEQRIIVNGMFYDAIIRYFGWVLKEKDYQVAFYAYTPQVLDGIEKALRGVSKFNPGYLGINAPRDHKRSDFGN